MQWARDRLGVAAIVLALALAGCATTPPADSPEEIAKRQQHARAQTSLDDGQKLYDEGAYSGALQSYLMALNSGVLTLPQQLLARKHMAFIHCVSNRVPQCKEEFQRAFSLSDKFDLAAAEAGHPIWGPVFRAVKSDVEQGRNRIGSQGSGAAQASISDKYFSDGMLAYDGTSYGKAIALFEKAAADATVLEKKIDAHKFIAFSYCLTNRTKLCRAEFGKILLLDPMFELSPSEAGHPSWASAFKAEKAKRKPASQGK